MLQVEYYKAYVFFLNKPIDTLDRFSVIFRIPADMADLSGMFTQIFFLVFGKLVPISQYNHAVPLGS